MGLPFGNEIDMWSLGCVLIQLHLGFPLFNVSDRAELVKKICDTIGSPPVDIYGSAKYYADHFDEANNYYDTNVQETQSSQNSFQFPPAINTSLKILLSRESPHFYEFISGMLTWDPSKRLTPAQALTHPFLFPQSYDLFNCFSGFQKENKEELIKEEAEKEKKVLMDQLKKEQTQNAERIKQYELEKIQREEKYQ